MEPQLTPNEVSLLRIRAQRLIPDQNESDPDIPGLVSAVSGIQAQDGTAAALSIRVRCKGIRQKGCEMVSRSVPARRDNLIVVILMLGGLLLRLWIAPHGGHPGDLFSFSEWASVLIQLGWRAVYPASSFDYPPLGILVTGFSAAVFRLGSPSGLPELSDPWWRFCVKLPAILADMGLGLILWQWAKSSGEPEQATPILSIPVWMVVIIAFHPALITLSAWWGQADSLVLLLVVIGFRSALKGPLFQTGLWIGMAAMVKPQGVVLLPLILLMALFQDRPIRAVRLLISGTVLAVAAAFAPLVAVGQAEFAILRFQGALIMPGWMTVNALNLWYLLTLGDGNWVYDGSLIHPDTASLIGFISSRRIGTALLTIWTAAVLWVQARSEITMKADSAQRQDARSGLQTYWRWSLAGALLYLGLFLWPTGAHERYNFGALILLLVARLDPSAPRRPLWGLFILLSILHILNLWWAAVPMPWMTLFAGSVPFGLVVSLGMLCAGAWGLYLLIQGRSVE